MKQNEKVITKSYEEEHEVNNYTKNSAHILIF